MDNDAPRPARKCAAPMITQSTPKKLIEVCASKHKIAVNNGAFGLRNRVTFVKPRAVLIYVCACL